MAYKALVKKYHPDVYPGDKYFAENIIKEINEAYTTLSDEELKRQYDIQQKENAKKKTADENRYHQYKTRQEKDNSSVKRNSENTSRQQTRNYSSADKDDIIGEFKGCLVGIFSGLGKILWKVVKYGIILFIIINLISGKLRSTAYNIWSGIQGKASNVVVAINDKILDVDKTEPEYAVEKYLEAMKNLDGEGVKPQVSSGTEFSEMTDSVLDIYIAVDDPEEFGYEMMKEVRKFDYYFNDANYGSGDQEATVDVKIHVVNLYELFASAITEYNQKMNDEDWINQYSYESALSGEEDVTAANIYEAIINEGLLGIGKPTIDRTIRFDLIKEGDQWVIVSVNKNKSFLEAMTGNFISVAEELNEIQ